MFSLLNATQLLHAFGVIFSQIYTSRCQPQHKARGSRADSVLSRGVRRGVGSGVERLRGHFAVVSQGG